MDLSVIFPGVAFVLGLLVSAYLFIEWLRHHRRPWFLIYWALALFLMYWFQVPVILTNLGRTTTITAFNFFFAVTFPVTFLALALIFLGVLDALNIQMSRRKKWLFLAWFVSAMAFFAYHFIVRKGVIQTYSLPIV